MRALNELLRGNPAARDEYLLRVELHSRLASDPDLFSSPIEEAALSACVPGQILSNRNQVPFPASKSRATGKRLVQVLALAACVILTVAGIRSWWFPPTASRTGTTSKAVAVLTRAVEARWANGTGPLRVGSALEPGWLRLESGMAQVVFYSGARLVLEGPAELKLISANEAVCPVGRLLAEVSPPARGFRVRTDQMNVVDLGTAFGIDATAARTEVHVFKGKVEFRPGTAGRQGLKEGQAAAVAGNAAPSYMVASTAAFTPLFEFQQRSLASEASRYDQWRLASALRNQDPSLLVHLDFENLSDSDWSLRNAAEGNKSVSDLTIVGCQRAEGRWREKLALEFQSVNDRVRLAVPGQFDSLTLSAWVCVKGLDRQINSLFMCDGFEPGTVHWLIRRDGVLGLTVMNARFGKHQIVASPPVITLDKFGMWLHLAVVLDGQAQRVSHYVNGVQVSTQALRLKPPFQISAAELGNWNAADFSNNDPALIRNFSGAMDEFCLFRRALDAAEIRTLYSEGKPHADP